MELKLEVWDSPNSAGVVVDAIRCAKLALDNGQSGRRVRAVRVLHEEPAHTVTDSEAHDMVEAFIADPTVNPYSNGAKLARRAPEEAAWQ